MTMAIFLGVAIGSMILAGFFVFCRIFSRWQRQQFALIEAEYQSGLLVIQQESDAKRALVHAECEHKIAAIEVVFGEFARALAESSANVKIAESFALMVAAQRLQGDHLLAYVRLRTNAITGPKEQS